MLLGGYSFIRFEDTMKKLGLAMLFMLPGCSADYSVELGNGYSYEHWGNNFIARTVAGEQRQVMGSPHETEKIVR